MKLSIRTHLIRYVFMGSMAGLFLGLFMMNSAYAAPGDGGPAKRATEALTLVMDSSVIATSADGERLLCAAVSSRLAGIGDDFGTYNRVASGLAFTSSATDPLSLKLSNNGDNPLTWAEGEASVLLIDNDDGEGVPVEGDFVGFVIIVDPLDCGLSSIKSEYVSPEGTFRTDAHLNPDLIDHALTAVSGGLFPVTWIAEGSGLEDHLDALVEAVENAPVLASTTTIDLALLAVSQITTLAQCLFDADPFLTYRSSVDDTPVACDSDDMIAQLADLLGVELGDTAISPSGNSGFVVTGAGGTTTIIPDTIGTGVAVTYSPVITAP